MPTLENGLAKLEDLPGGGKGIAVTIKLQAGPQMGRRRAGDDQGPRVHLEGRRATRRPASPTRNPWTRAKRIDVVDDHTAVLHLDKRAWSSTTSGTRCCPSTSRQPIFAKATGARRLHQADRLQPAPTTPGLWDGPYRITKYQSGVQIVLEPNPYWAGTKPGFKRIVIKLIENTAALQANLLSGDVDMVAGEGVGLTIDQVLALQKQYPDRFTYIFKPEPDLRAHRPADPTTRSWPICACAGAALRARPPDAGGQAVRGHAAGGGYLGQSAGPDTTPMTCRSYPYDPARAKALLTEAGWTPGADGICRNATGERLSLEFVTTSGNRLRELQQQVLQSQWKAACIEVTIKNEPPRTLFGETLKHRSYTGMVMYAWSQSRQLRPAPDAASCGQIPTAANNWGGSNAIAFSDPTMDADIDAAETELDPAKQKAIWADMQQIYADAAAGAAAVLPRGRACHAEMAEGLHAHRP